MIEQFEIVGSDSPRPDAERIIFCDGTVGRLFHPETDLELSHWRSNHTPSQYRADTSTEICFRFLDQPLPGQWLVAVNNHLDVDGILSVYVLIHSSHALAHRKSLIEAAEMGDFWGWGESNAQRVFQGLTHLMDGRQQSGTDTNAIYAEAFQQIPSLIDGTHADCLEIEESLEPLQTGVELVDSGEITRSVIDSRCAHYVLPMSVMQDDPTRALYIPDFNEAVSSKAILWPQVRARLDSERVCIVSVEMDSGWHHDLWFPGYLWADTENRWTVPGMIFHGGMETYDLSHPRFAQAIGNLQRHETASGCWTLADNDDTSPFHRNLQSLFPVVARFVDEEGNPTPSRLTPQRIAGCFAGVFE